MVHVAIFDSVNAIDRKFTPYAVEALADPDASPEAAAAAAAHAVLVNLYPSRQADLDIAYAASLASVADGSSKTEGIAVGESVATVILALRSTDGSAVTLPYTVPPGPGVYQPDPAALFVALVYIGVHPDYVSQHAAIGGAAAQVLAHFFGTDDFSFAITTSTAPGGVFRSYDSFAQAANENMNSRLWLGVHFRTACRHGLNQGKQVAHYVFHHFLQPIKE